MTFNMKLFWLAFVCLTVISSSVSGRKKGSRIFGGAPVQITNYPYQVAIFSNFRPDINEGQVCGGSIIAENYVLTAAHCFKQRNAIYTVKYGIDNLRSQSEKLPIRNIFRHPKYNPYTAMSDIAVLELEYLINFSPQALQINLRSREAQPGEVGIVSGWGVTESGLKSTVLRAARLPVISRQACSLSVRFQVTNNHICTKEKGKTTCNHDSGSPFVIGTSQVGLVMAQSALDTTECGHLGTIYTNVAYFKDFIDSMTENKAKWSSN